MIFSPKKRQYGRALIEQPYLASYTPSITRIPHDF